MFVDTKFKNGVGNVIFCIGNSCLEDLQILWAKCPSPLPPVEPGLLVAGVGSETAAPASSCFFLP